MKIAVTKIRFEWNGDPLCIFGALNTCVASRELMEICQYLAGNGSHQDRSTTQYIPPLHQTLRVNGDTIFRRLKKGVAYLRDYFASIAVNRIGKRSCYRSHSWKWRFDAAYHIPCERSPMLEIPSGAAAYNIVQMTGMEPMSRPDRPNVLLREDLTGLQILDDK